MMRMRGAGRAPGRRAAGADARRGGEIRKPGITNQVTTVRARRWLADVAQHSPHVPESATDRRTGVGPAGGLTSMPAAAASSTTAPDPDAEEALAVPGCLACGACCFSTASEYVRVTGADWTRLGADAADWAQFVNNRAFMHMRDGHCAALDIQRDAETGAAAFVCAIYARRPQVCRDLGRGSPECAAEFVRKRATAIVAVLATGGAAHRPGTGGSPTESTP